MSVVDDVFDVKDQVALVTGGASGLGYAFASILADAGARVVIADWNADALGKAVGSLADAAAAASGAPPEGPRRPAPRLRPDARRQRRGRGARLRRSHRRRPRPDRHRLRQRGVARGRPPLFPEGWLDDMSMTDYNALIDVNLHGVVYTVQAAAKHMKRQRSGSIVTTASTAGLRNDPYTPYSYTIAKAGVINFTRQAAHDLARWGVRVNAIAPGPVQDQPRRRQRDLGRRRRPVARGRPARPDGQPRRDPRPGPAPSVKSRQLHDRRRLPHRRRRPPARPLPPRRRLTPTRPAPRAEANVRPRLTSPRTRSIRRVTR